MLDPIRERRAYYEEHEGQVRDVILDGSARARETAKATMAEVHEAMGMGSL